LLFLADAPAFREIIHAKVPQLRGHTMFLSGIKIGIKAQQQIDKAVKVKAHNIENKKS
jgi:hypothetical protein